MSDYMSGRTGHINGRTRFSSGLSSSLLRMRRCTSTVSLMYTTRYARCGHTAETFELSLGP